MAAPLRLRSPAVEADRRDVLRHPVTLTGGLSSAEGGPQPVTLTDISDRGCRIERPAALTRDTVVTLSFGGYAPFSAHVAWTSPDAAGLRFDQALHPALIAQVLAAANGRKRKAGPGKAALAVVRREERERLWYLRRPVSLRIGQETVAGVLCDLSTEGCRVETAQTPPAGAQLRVTLERRHPLPGEVRWALDEAIGVQFTTPLSPETVRAIAEEG